MIVNLLPGRGTPRILVAATLVNTFGNGAYMTTSVLFLTHSVGLTPAQVAIGLSAAALAGIVLTTPMGYLVDRLGARDLQVAALLTSAASFAAMTLVHDLWSFVPLACLIAVGDATAKTANNAMIAEAVAPDQRVRTRAFVRSVNNGGLALGTLAGGLPLLLDSRAGYLAVLVLNAVTYLAAALIVTRAGRVAPAGAPAGGPRMATLRDRPFLAFALVDGLVMALLNGILRLALPLWLVAYTHAPVALVTVALLLNTTGCVTLQVWASRGVHDTAGAIPVGRRGALLLAASCVLFGLTAGRPSWLVGVLVLVAGTVHVLGELWLSGASFAVVFGLPPHWAQGRYQGVYQTGRQLGNTVAPPLLTALVIGSGVAGWIAVAAIFTAAGLAYPSIIRSGLRRVEVRSYAEAASAA